jgi:uncharacterized protein YoxC
MLPRPLCISERGADRRPRTLALEQSVQASREDWHMRVLALVQAGTVHSWVGPVMAISLAIIALSFLSIAAALAFTALKLSGQIRKIATIVDGLQDEVGRTLKTVRRLTEQGQDVMVLVRHEAGAFAQTARRLRRKTVRAVDRVETKLQELETLYDVVHDEVENAALDAAAALRSVRRGNGMLGRVRRILVPSR